jgi:hypothetical protein
MTELEERLRRELRELRPDPGSIRPLRIPPARPYARIRRWLVPLAAAAAVIVVIAAVAAGSGLTRGGSVPPGPTAPMTTRLATKTGLPPYYVVTFQRYINDGRTIATYAAVHVTATGAELASVRVPTLITQGGANGPTISGAADDRTFVLMESGNTSVHDVVWCFLLRVAANGRSLKVTKLPVSVPSSMAIDNAALSPDGTRLAMSAQWSCKARRCDDAGIRVVDLATDSVRSWTTQVNGAPFNVSWAGNDELAFEWQTSLNNPPAGQRTGYRLIAVTGTGGNLLAGPAVASPDAESSGYVPAAFVTPGGADVITSEVRAVRTQAGHAGAAWQVLELSASTGRTVRVLYTTTAHGGNEGSASQDQGCNVLSLGPDLTDPLVACFAVGVLVAGKLVTLPGFPSAASSGISGQNAIAW